MTIAAGFGYLSAGLWLTSAFVRLPRNIYFQAVLGAPNEKVEELVRQLTKASYLNAAAAFCSAVIRFPVSDVSGFIGC